MKLNSPDRLPVVVSIKDTGNVDIDVPAVPGYDGFDKLRCYLQNEHGAIEKQCIDGPDARKSVLSLACVDINLIYEDPYGNSIHSIGPDVGHKVEDIGRDLELRLRDF